MHLEEQSLSRDSVLGMLRTVDERAALVRCACGALAAALRGQSEIGYGLAVSSLVFGVSLGLRTIDEPMCTQIVIGTHWAWHVLNALTLYLVIKLHIDQHPKARASGV